MGAAEVEAFLTHLAVAKRVSASTQNQAKTALLFLYFYCVIKAVCHYKFEPVELGAEWTSIEARGSGGPIVLIEGRSATTGLIVKSRLDTQK